jgi:hypothetical protein
LKQARHRASRLFLKDGARSSLPQYLHTNFSTLDAVFDDRNGRRADFLVFEGGAAFGLAAPASFFVDAAGSWTGDGLGGQAIFLLLSLANAPVAGLVFAFTWFSFSGRGFGATGRRQDSSLCRGDMGRRLAGRAVGPSKIAPREESADLLELRGNLLSPGPCASANRAHTRAFRAIL